MLSKTHIAAGIFTVLSYMNFNNNIEFNCFELIPGAMLGAATPDIDTKNSWVSQTVPFIDDKLRELGLLKHRGLTHGLTGIISMVALYMIISNNFTLGFIIGYISHCVLDIVASKLEITCKNDKKVFNFFWTLNLTLIINYTFGFDTIYCLISEFMK
jgi:membrane-bound metal-dependent hydrolase YbcI (DUF457 family)